MILEATFIKAVNKKMTDKGHKDKTFFFDLVDTFLVYFLILVLA